MCMFGRVCACATGAVLVGRSWCAVPISDIGLWVLNSQCRQCAGISVYRYPKLTVTNATDRHGNLILRRKGYQYIGIPIYSNTDISIAGE